jgi:preprotein translocase subunit YajC
VDQLVGFLFFVVPLLLIFMVFNRSRRQQRDRAVAQSAITPGSRVMTTSGVYGRVVSSDETTVVLEIAPGVDVTWARRAVARLVEEPTNEQIDLSSEPDDLEQDRLEPGPTERDTGTA